MDYLVYFTPVSALIALAFAAILAKKVLSYSEGTQKMAQIASHIRKGANAYLKRQYKGVALFFAAVFAVLFALAIFSKVTNSGLLSMFTPFAFVTGGLFSGLSGFLGMKIATSANARTANAASEGLNRGLRVAFSSGAVMGFVVVGLGLLDISVWYLLLTFVFNLPTQEVTETMLTFGMGASSMALFARVGGGIFTKAADVGADLVGKVEAGIPEDDPRNPAVIADNVGDNVGDVAGMGADLYESYVGSIISAAALAVAAFRGDAKNQVLGVALAMGIAAIGVIASIVGTFFVKTKENATQKNLLASLRKGTYISSALIVIASFLLVFFGMGSEHLSLFFAIISGLIAGVLIGISTEYYTSDTYKPTQDLAKTSETGTATVVIGGVSLGMKSTAIPVIIISISVLVSFFVCGGADNASMGLFGIGLSAVGMLSTLGITLATDAYGPVADNAGGIAQMAGMDEEVRRRTDALDSLGNTTAATGKGFAIGSAALTALALIASYVDKVTPILAQKEEALDISLMNPKVLIGLFVGGMLAFLFSSMTMNAVGRAAQSIVVEVRRQFREIKGLMEGQAEADYESCVDLCTKSAQKEMKAPALLGVVAPIVVGLILGPSGVVGMLGGALVAGFLLAVMMANSGGAWDNAKKYVETGHFGGKGSDCHKAAVVGDTVGDPFKDTAGPSINILIKLLSMVSIVFAAIVSTYHLL